MTRAALLVLAMVVAAACANANVVSPTPTPTPVTASASADALGPGRLVSGSFRSAALGRTMPYTVYLPTGYDADAGTRFPTLYLLHGGGGSRREWIDYGAVTAADALITAREIPRMVIVFPQGDEEYWVDHIVSRIDDGAKWGTYLAKEVVPEIDAKFRTLAEPRGRAIGGSSMGGHGAMQLALNFPGIWSAIGAHSPSLRPVGDAPTYLGTGAEFAARDPYALIGAKPALARSYRWWIDAGDADPWIAATRQIHEELSALGIAHEWHEWPGDHSAAYWSAHIPDYLRWYGSVLG